MSAIYKQLAFDRLYQLTLVAGEEGHCVTAAVDIPTSLTKGKEYSVKLMGGLMFYYDDSDIPVSLPNESDLVSRFEPVLDQSEFEHKVSDFRGRLEHRVEGILHELNLVSPEATSLVPGDIIIFEDDHEKPDAKPYVVAKVLNREETRLAAKAAGTLMSHDLLVYHNSGELGVSILSSHRVRRVGSLEEWGLPPLDERLVERLTVFNKHFRVEI